MRSARAILLWLLLGIAGAGLLVWAYPRAFPFLPHGWRIDQRQAVAIALERLRELGPPVENPYVVTRLGTNALLERRLLLARQAGREGEVRASGLTGRLLVWEVTVYPPDALRDQWTYQAEVGFDGKVTELRLNLDPEAKGRPIPLAAARAQADAFLARQGIDLARYREPVPRSYQLAARTDLYLRYPDRRPTPGGGQHGIQVAFLGDRLAGFESWWDSDPRQRDLQRIVQQVAFAGIGSVILTYLALLLLAVPFLRRYHEGEIGVRRGIELFCLVLTAGIVELLLAGGAFSQGAGFGFATRQQLTWLVVVALSIFRAGPTALLAFFAWSVGESILRERWGGKLAAFDALFQGDWANATVARASLRGAAAGICIAGGLVAATLPLARAGAFPMIATVLSGTEDSLLPSLELLASALVAGLPMLLTAALCVIPLSFRGLGRAGGAVVSTVLIAVLLTPYLSLPLPLPWGFAIALVLGAVVLLLFLRYDFLTVLLAGLLAPLLVAAFPLLVAASPRIAAHGWIAVALALAPLWASLRYLGSDREFVYRYEDIPPHVRRIAERERQRVELETARGIQSSILPDLPPQLAGVQLAHAYLPATEVGGDFYDVLALEDGRLAIAVGDVAGHGVSSGLVMSMAKSALAVQVTFDPDVQAVFSTLNRMVFQTARKRLLTTLCYLLLDPVERELLYASAGHLFPYVISPRGAVHALESIAYPLGVRGELKVEARSAHLAAGDILFLFSDGVVEARSVPSLGDGEEFGFPRLEASLARHAGKGVQGLCDGVLADVQRFTGNGQREDDQTILVLQLAAD